ncbi:MAG: sporulation transcription factor Spo0A [Limnochordia bacterium]|jgi:two-component system response regulator (stage 0 sporulation protein A)
MGADRTRILIADNNMELCEMLTEFIELQGDMTVVATAMDGEAALEALSKLPVDVVILDVAMPRLDGIAVLQRMRELDLQPPPRIIVLSALGREDIMHRLTNLGADYYVVKPIDLEVLAERIREFCPQPSHVAEQTAISASGGVRGPVRPRSAPSDLQVTELLHKLGVPAHMKGYLYLRDAVQMALEDDRLLAGGLTKRLYPMVAEKYQSSPGGVEAAIRNALTAWWERGNRELFATMTGRNGVGYGKIPTNSAMIAELADQIRFQNREKRQAF